jgi:YfiH family protein
LFAHHEVRGGVGVAVTDRHDGVSTGPWASLNLGDHVGDDPSCVTENRGLMCAAAAVEPDSLVVMQQVHGATVAVIDGPAAQPAVADALVTRTPGLALLVQVADCTPVLLSDRRAGVIAAVHVGRPGLVAGVLPAALAAMAGLRARPERTYAVVGPGVCPRHYEVPEQMRADVERAVPGTAAASQVGTPAVDIRAGVLSQLHDAGLKSWMVVPHCTAEDDRFFSYRRDGVTGRFGALVWFTP